MGGVIVLVVGVAAAFASVMLVRKRWRFTDTPTSDAGHVFPGLGEVFGTVSPIGPPAAAATDGAACVWWEYKVERRVQSKDSSHWVTEEHGVTAHPFMVKDHSGAVRVVIDERAAIGGTEQIDIDHLSLGRLRPFAEVMLDTYETSERDGVLGAVLGSNSIDEPIDDFSGTWRAYERRLCIDEPVFITGRARITAAGDEVEFARTDAQGKGCLLEITAGDEREAMATQASGWAILLMSVVSLVCFAIASNAIAGSIVLFPLIAIGVVVGLLGAGVWNRIKRARERCLFAWSLIDVACEQRSELVPQLQAVVGAAFAHERSVLESVAAARALGRAPTSSRVDTVRAADDAASRVVVTVEATPSLHTQPNVAQLMDQVRLLNDRVAFGRRFYNDAVLRLDNRRRQFPDSLFARMARVSPLPYIDPPTG